MYALFCSITGKFILWANHVPVFGIQGANLNLGRDKYAACS